MTQTAEELAVHSNCGEITDVDIARDARHAIENTINLPPGTVKVAVRDHKITLTGVVTWHFQRKAALNAVRYLRGVRGVDNAVVVTPTGFLGRYPEL